MAITRTKTFPVNGESPIVLHNVPQSVTLVGDITGDKGINEVWEDTKRIEDFEVQITTLDEYSTGVPHKTITRVDTLNESTGVWAEGTKTIYTASEKTFSLNYKGHEKDFEVKIEDDKAQIHYRWGMNGSHDLVCEKAITIAERPISNEGGGSTDEDDGDNWGYPIFYPNGALYRIAVPSELQSEHHYLYIQTSLFSRDLIAVYPGVDIKMWYSDVPVEDEAYYAMFESGYLAYAKPSDWYYLDENEEKLSGYKVEVLLNGPKLTTEEVTSVIFDKSKTITSPATGGSTMKIPFPYKKGYVTPTMNGLLLFKESLENLNDVIASMPCSSLPNFSEYGFSTADCIFYYGDEPEDGTKFHYLFMLLAEQKVGYFDDSGNFIEIELSF